MIPWKHPAIRCRAFAPNLLALIAPLKIDAKVPARCRPSSRCCVQLYRRKLAAAFDERCGAFGCRACRSAMAGWKCRKRPVRAVRHLTSPIIWIQTLAVNALGNNKNTQIYRRGRKEGRRTEGRGRRDLQFTDDKPQLRQTPGAEGTEQKAPQARKVEKDSCRVLPSSYCIWMVQPQST